MIAACTFCASSKEYKVNTNEFTKLKVSDNINVVYKCDPSRNGTATFECPDNLAGALMFENNGKGKLTVEIAPDYIGKEIDLPTVYVFSEFLTEVESSSAKKVQITELPRIAELKATLFGNGTLELIDIDTHKVSAASMTGHGTIKINGKAADALFKVAGNGKIDGNGLEATKVTCHVFGAGEIHCKPIDELKLKGLGSTTVYYSGNPKQIKKQGIGKLVKED
ncbi:MAG: DUF2807 domain-containing protein [Prevotella sp.]|nr:DUF2807 domain-containing protein [Prevotella sp.]MCM1074509.1 DUF2807 domain-containing protein [Ruminococcus sp.]